MNKMLKCSVSGKNIPLILQYLSIRVFCTLISMAFIIILFRNTFMFSKQ